MKAGPLHAGFAGFTLLAASLGASVASAAEPRYRIVPIVSNDPSVVLQGSPTLNNRGQVVGTASAPGGTGNHAFLWQNGIFTDLHAIVAPDAANSGAADINSHRTIIGTRDSGGYELQGTQVTAVTVVPGETTVNPVAINDRGQMIVESFGGPVNGEFFVDGDDAEHLTPLPGALDAVAVALNERGVAAGDSIFFPEFTRHGTIWQNGGPPNDLGVPAGFDSTHAAGINSHNRVAGFAQSSVASVAASWSDGAWTLLPSIAPGEPQFSEATDINETGTMIGSTTLTGGDTSVRHATLWQGSRALILDDLVVASDPLKPFVRLTFAQWLNDRGDIITFGTDSRKPNTGETIYFLRRVDD
jgi:probable HAF family extracellular repeat protein